MVTMTVRWRWILALALLGANACGSSGGPGCNCGCLCIQTEQQCSANGCYVKYSKSSDGARVFSGCLPGSPTDGGSQ
jgi:hypothetical protein